MIILENCTRIEKPQNWDILDFFCIFWVEFEAFFYQPKVSFLHLNFFNILSHEVCRIFDRNSILENLAVLLCHLPLFGSFFGLSGQPKTSTNL